METKHLGLQDSSPSRWGWVGAAQGEMPSLCRWLVWWQEDQRLGPCWWEKFPLPTVLCPFHNPWIDKARKVATEVAWVEGLLFVLQEQQEPFSSTAEWHIPTGSLIKNKNNTILHCIWLLPFQPVWTRRPLLLAFVIINYWVALRGSMGWWKGCGAGRAGLKSFLWGLLVVCS